MELMIYSFAFLAVTLLIIAAYYLLFSQPGRIQQRLEELGQPSPGHNITTGTVGAVPPPAGLNGLVQDLLTGIGRFFGSAKSSGRLRQKLRKAGYYNDNAVVIYTGAEMLVGLLLPSLGIGLLSLLQVSVLRFLIFIPPLAVLGFVVPSLYLSARTSKRKALLQRGLPDALDLMVSCVEAGLSLNAALVRVAQELRRVHPGLSQEFDITNFEIRAGKTREEALRNLGQRSGVKDLKSFAAMLIQTDRFGTSIAQALRVFSDSMRTKRRQRAEKAAAETTIKLLFPLVFFIFPFLLIVLLGPGMIQLMETLLPVLKK
ncbi:MAG: type II secretion system F family protein [Acidobacteria bacterium]|nr:type II secretion system F family protein [Acidobacteriota bacterium]